MKARIARPLTQTTVIAVLLLTILPLFQSGAGTGNVQAKALTYSQLSKIQKRILSGFVASERDVKSASEPRGKQRSYFPSGDDGCSQRVRSNIKVNQNCLNLTDPDLQGRAQANNETAIAYDPTNPNHIIATSNNYIRGDGNCYLSYSLDRGQSWTDTAIPMGFTRGREFGAARQYWQSGGDPAVAWDTKGNAYFQCMVFQRGSPVASSPDLSSAVYIFRSTHNFGASWNFPGRPVIESADVGGTGIPPLEDKPYMTIDDQVGSPFQDRIYVTYTEFSSDGSAYIWESFSNDYGETFSAPTLVSSTSPLCVNTFGAGTPRGNCNENQFSQPFTGSDGALYVAYDNYNNALNGSKDNHHQILLAKSTDGGKSFNTPVKVADFYDLPDCATYQGGLDAGNACVPEKAPTTNSYFRAANYPSGAVDPTNRNRVVVTFGSYINAHSNESNGCVPAGLAADLNNLFNGVKTPGACNNDILISVSNDGGQTFTGTTTDPRKLTSITQSSRQAKTDQWWQWAAFTRGGRLAVSYYDRQYGSDETTGFSDFSLSGSNNLTGFAAVRVTSGSMPPPTQFGGTFFGDYTGLTVINNTAYPLWMDTRSPALVLCPGTGAPGIPPAICTISASNASIANDQDIFTEAVPVP